MSTPTTVEVGQMWRDTDQRSKGAGEFTIVAVVDPDGWHDTAPGLTSSQLERVIRVIERHLADLDYLPAGDCAVVHRTATGRLTRIRASRLLHGPYELIGKSR